MEVLEDVSALGSDTVRVRLQGGLHDKGRVRLVDAADMVQGVRGLLFAGAAGVEKRLAVYQGRNTNRVEEFIESLEVAAPEKGSFVVRVLAPIPPTLADFKVKAGEPVEPFARLATVNTIEAVSATVAAAEDAQQKGNIEVFKDHVEEGVSANICEALAHVSGGNPTVTVNVGVSWSGKRPQAADTPRKAVVPSKFVSLIERAAPILRGKRGDEASTCFGLAPTDAQATKRREGAEGRLTTGSDDAPAPTEQGATK